MIEMAILKHFNHFAGVNKMVSQGYNLYPCHYREIDYLRIICYYNVNNNIKIITL